MQSSINYHSITCKKAFRKLAHPVGPYDYDMNVYRGCAHRCVYCFALYSQRYLQQADFYHDIFIKENIVESLEKQLASKKWGKHIVNIGSVCDSYQPIEAQRKLMPEILKLLIRYATPCIISTKSDLILRDLELIKELANITCVNIASTITCVDEQIASHIEPGAVSVERRAAMLQTIRQETNACVGIHMMPILPLISDRDEHIEGMMKLYQDIDAEYMICGSLYLRGVTKQHFYEFLKQYQPELVKQYHILYQGGYLDKVYKKDLYERISIYQKRYHVNFDYNLGIRKRMPKYHDEIEQLSLF